MNSYRVSTVNVVSLNEIEFCKRNVKNYRSPIYNWHPVPPSRVVKVKMFFSTSKGSIDVKLLGNVC